MRSKLIYACSLITVLTGISHAAERVALIVGNNSYSHATSLKTATNDAKGIWSKLTEFGFDAGNKPLLNGTLQELVDEIELFKERARSASVAVVYFAGHGIEYRGSNYLIPVDAILSKATQLQTQAYSLNNLLNEIKNLEVPARLVILDCCRNNPLPERSWTRGDQTFADISDEMLGGATMVVFSAAPGTKAYDRVNQLDQYSPFATALLKQIALPGMGLFNLFAEVEKEVFIATNEGQKPKIRFNGDISPFAALVLNKPASTIPKPTQTMPAQQTRPIAGPLDSPDSAIKSGTKAGQIISVELSEGIAMKFAWCPPGDFRRDSTCRIRLTTGFWIAQTECSRSQYRAVINGPRLVEREGTLPVDGISWAEASDYCEILTERLHKKLALTGKWIVTLPTEAQWEYACRATWDSPYGVGDGHTLKSKEANFRFTNDFEYHYTGKPKDVGSYTANTWGLHDMHGNVWEYCADWFGPLPNHDLVDPVGANLDNATGHVCRGGSWYNSAERCTSGTRANSNENPLQPIDSVAGFRCLISENESSMSRN